MHRRTLVVLVSIAAVLGLIVLSVPSASGGPGRRSHSPTTIGVRGGEDFEANALIFSTFRFNPGTLFAHQGERVRLADQDRVVGAPHTLTVVRKGQLPGSFNDLFACGPCNAALDKHFSSDPPRFRVGIGDGLNEPGDSLLIFEGERIGATLTAAPDTSLWFVCAFHPWMQGRIDVG